MNRETIIETMARALCLTATDTHTGWEHYKPEAVEVLAAIEAAGVRLVPVEATAKMVNGAVSRRVKSYLRKSDDMYADIYTAMIAASPYALKEPGATEIFQELAKRQEPLGAEFEAAIGDLSTLYET